MQSIYPDWTSSAAMSRLMATWSLTDRATEPLLPHSTRADDRNGSISSFRPCASHFRSRTGADIFRAVRHVSKVPCWTASGSGLARTFFTLQARSVMPCVRPVAAAHMTAGHNALRGSGHQWVVLIAGSTGSALRNPHAVERRHGRPVRGVSLPAKVHAPDDLRTVAPSP